MSGIPWRTAYYYLDDVSIEEIKPADAGADQEITSGSTIQLGNHLDQAAQYTWQPAAGLDNANAPNPLASPEETTTYTVSKTQCGVISSDYVTVYVNHDIFIPNAFSPNGDGNNDTLKVLGKGIAEIEFCIYNRWGELIFKTHNPKQGWDGNYKDQKSEPGVYVWYVKATMRNDKEIFKKGNVTLMR